MSRTLHTPPRSLHKRCDPADYHRERERLLRLRHAEPRDPGDASDSAVLSCGDLWWQCACGREWEHDAAGAPPLRVPVLRAA